MKNRIFTMVLMSLMLLSSRAFSADLGMVRMGIVEGDVQIYAGDAGTWVPAAINTPLGQGDRVWVPAGARSELQVQGGLRIRLDAATSFDILTLDNNAYQFYLNGGRSYINNRTYGIDHLQIDTPVSSIGCYDDSVTMVDVEENGATEISVLKGYAYAETRNGKVRVPAGNTLRIEENLTAQMFPLSSPDEWEEWNRNLDGAIGAGGSSVRYLPEELNDYGQDFDNYGRWLYDSGYGYVWTPTFSISTNWAPYHVGRWVWIGGQYVWISHEPWGWAPYHYGRWIHRPHVGWCWVPPRRGAVWWGPGYVGWVYTANQVAWVPLAPGDTYYGHGYYGPGSVNLNTMAGNHNVINRNFVNRNVRNAVRIMHRDTFLHGGRVAAPTWNNPFGQRNVGIGPPRFKPDKATYAPAIRTIPVTKQPPRRIRAIKPEALRTERKLTPDKRGSAFTPGIPARTLPTTVRETPRKTEQKPATEIYKIRQQVPKIKETPPVITTPGTGKRSGKELKPAITPEKHPATLNTAPQPVAPQPVAPTPVWSPSQTRQQEQKAPPVRRQTTPTSAPEIRQTPPSANKVQKQVPQTQRLQHQTQPVHQVPQTRQKQQPIAPQPVAPRPVWSPSPARQPTQGISPASRQAAPITAPKVQRQTTPAAPQVQQQAPQPRQQQQQIIRQEQQTIHRPQPVSPQTTVAQPPASQQTTPITTPEPRQTGGRAGDRSHQGQGNVKGENR
jgi:hypothetical protein